MFAYKKEHGFDVRAPRIAVVVQRQIDSEVAGVAFSLNPVTNDYDEAAIDASWGLGTSVVDGRVSPDHFVLDKVARRVVEEARGDKRVSVRLDPEGSGTVERTSKRSADRTLSDAQLHELTDVLGRVESLYGEPVDVEWAYADGALHVLQARPITAYVPLPPEMITGPGQRRRLYSDIALSSGLTINAPISPMGLDWMRTSVGHLVEAFLGSAPAERPVRDALWFFAGGRMYQHLSNVMWLASPKKLAQASAESDALMAATLSAVDAARVPGACAAAVGEVDVGEARAPAPVAVASLRRKSGLRPRGPGARTRGLPAEDRSVRADVRRVAGLQPPPRRLSAEVRAPGDPVPDQRDDAPRSAPSLSR